MAAIHDMAAVSVRNTGTNISNSGVKHQKILWERDSAALLPNIKAFDVGLNISFDISDVFKLR